MQGYDFVLNQEHNVTLQISGSDQWKHDGGTELMRRKAD